ncbi:hypothetical protein [Streptomyces luteireticuli]|uniref:hypothetical protein n=1 Tax=Streptomyces luteireticuli TaxID=173858 RepID=UPI003555D299
MTRPAARLRRSGLLLLVLAAVLAVLGLFLLALRPPPAAPRGKASVVPASTPSNGPRKVPGSRPSASRPAPAAPSGIPVPGDGPAGDRAVQRMLDRSSSSRLPAEQERRIVALAERVWRADVTGTSRSPWPGYFTDSPPPRPRYTGIRLQGTAVRAADRGRVGVLLVWAGTDSTGRQTDGLTTRLLFSRTARGWEPVR